MGVELSSVCAIRLQPMRMSAERFVHPGNSLNQNSQGGGSAVTKLSNQNSP